MNKERMKQRLTDYGRALSRLKEIINEDPRKSPAIIDGVIQRFEFTFELAWKTAQTVLAFKGIEVTSPRAVIKEAFVQKYFSDGEVWIRMLDDRNRSSHTYDEADAQKIYQAIRVEYVQLLENLYERLSQEAK